MEIIKEKLRTFTIKKGSYLLLSLLFYIITLLFLSFLIYRSFYPTFYVDEGLYIGAATRVLGGDLLLQNYWFDKPFMQFYWIIPGILLFGYNILGYSISGIICSVWSFIKLPKVFQLKKLDICSIIIAFLFFINPFHISYFTSSMAEPFMLLCLLNFLFYYFQFLQNNERGVLKKSYIWFTLGFCVKQSALMYSPVLLGLFLSNKLTVKKIKTELIFFFSSTKYLWLIAFLYQISNKKKFAAITWFSKLTRPKQSYTFLEHFGYWSKEFFLTQRSNLLAVFIIFLLVFYIYQTLRKLKKDSFSLKHPFFEKFNDPKVDLFVFILPLFLHFIGISLSNVKHIDRYMFLFNLQVFITLLRFITTITPKQKKIVTFVGFFILIFNIKNFKGEELDENYTKGKSLLEAKSLIHEPSIVHTRLKWQFYPNNLDVFLDSCLKEECLKEKQKNLPSSAGHFLIENDPPYSIYKHLPQGKLQPKELNLNKSIWEIFKRRIRIPKKMQLTTLEKISELSIQQKFGLQKHTESWKLIFEDKKVKLEMIVHPLISKGRTNEKYGLADQHMLSLHISDANVYISKRKFKAMVLLDFILKNLTIPIDFINSPNLNDRKFSYVSILSANRIQYHEISYER